MIAPDEIAGERGDRLSGATRLTKVPEPLPVLVTDGDLEMNKPEMTAPPSPEDFLQQARTRIGGRPSQLPDHTALILQLLATGYSAYLVWRYLNEVSGVKVGRTAVWKFCRGLRRTTDARGGSGAASAIERGPASTVLRTGEVPQVARARAPSVPRVQSGDVVDRTPEEAAAEVSGEGSGPPAIFSPRSDVPSDRVPPVAVGAPVPHPSGPATNKEPSRSWPNEEVDPPAFNPTALPPAPRMEVADGTPDWIPGDVLKPFKISGTRGSNMLEKHRRRTAEDDDADTSQQGPHSDKHDNVREH